MSDQRRSRGRGLLRKLNYVAFLPLASRAPAYGRLIVALLTDDRIPASRKAVLAFAAGFVVSPADIVPDRIPVLGALDDVAIVIIALDVFLESVPQHVLDEKLAEIGMDPRELERDLDRVRGLVPRPLRAVLVRVPDAIESAAVLVKRSGLDTRVRTGVRRRLGTLPMEGRPA